MSEVGMMSKLNMITAKVHCHRKGTAFLINKKYALTARHVVLDENNQISTKVTLEFLCQTNFINNRVKARIYDSNVTYDIAILELEEQCLHVPEFIELSNQSIELTDNWETTGFPMEWEDNNNFYLKGDIYQIANKENITYDIHLTSPYIKDEWEYGLDGLSGSPLIIDGKIKAIILTEEYSVIKSPIKAVSISKCFDFLNRDKLYFESTFGSKNNLIYNRLSMQKKKCDDLFKKIDYSSNVKDFNVKVNAYHVKYDVNGKSMINELSTYLTTTIIDYACTLYDIYSSKYGASTINMLETFKKTNKVIEEIKRNKKLGSLILWMIVEGVIGAPKAIKRISVDENIGDDFFVEAHIGLSKDKNLEIYLGEGRLVNDLESGVKNSVVILKDLKNVQDNIFIADQYFIEHMEDNILKNHLRMFINPLSRDWKKVSLVINVFSGYDSKILKMIENQGHPKEFIEGIIEQRYVKECTMNEELICEILKREAEFSDIKINWFTIPFISIEEFEETIIKELAKVV